MESYHVRAHNTAPDSENRIHDDHTAALYGFRGGLVPGVTVYGYLAVPVIRAYGDDWLARGGMNVRFRQPVYEGVDLSVELHDDTVSARLPDGAVCAVGHVLWPRTDPPDVALYPEAPLPGERPPATPVSLGPGTVLGTLHATVPVAEPAALLTLCNHILMQNVKLDPWIHAASEIRHFSPARDGEDLAVRGRVAERFERKGNQFVVLDLIVVAGHRLVQQVWHTAIYELALKPASPASPSNVPA